MLTLDQLRKIPRQAKIAHLRGITPDSIIRALLAYLPDTFLSDRQKLHTAIQKLRERAEYRDLLKDFEPVFAPLFPYSPLLERVLKRLQEARLLAARNPDFVVFEISKEARAAITKDIQSEFSQDQIERLQEIASNLRENLAVVL